MQENKDTEQRKETKRRVQVRFMESLSRNGNARREKHGGECSKERQREEKIRKDEEGTKEQTGNK